MNINNRNIMKYVVAVVAGLFLIWNILWAVNFYSYYKLTSGYEKSPVSYIKSGEDYTYTVACPAYLSTTGNYALTNNDNLSIIIWPGFMGGAFEYGIGIYDEILGSTYRFYVDKNLEYLPIEDNKYSEAEAKTLQILLEKYRENLDKMYQLAKAEWMEEER